MRSGLTSKEVPKMLSLTKDIRGSELIVEVVER